MDHAVIGVGLVGAGPVMQAIHLPTLARMQDRFGIVHVADVDADVARHVAGRVGARYSTSAENLIADPDVDVVVVGTPNRFHAEQVIAACQAGKRAVLCEKPLAVRADEAVAISAAAAASGTPVIVGTMHSFDAGWIRGLAGWQEQGATAHSVRISCVIPPNNWAEDFATEMHGRPTGPPAVQAGIEADVASVVGGVLGLAIHELPLARQLLPTEPPVVVSTALLAPWGYEIIATVGDSVLELHGVVGASWEPSWTLTATSAHSTLDVQFPLSFVQAGSAVSRLATRDGVAQFGPYDDSGYIAEWEFLSDVLEGLREAPDLDVLVGDFNFASEIAEQAARQVRGTVRA